MIVRAVIFTHAPDLAIAILAARSLRLLGVEVALALDDADIDVHAESFTILRTSFPRRRNLNGLPCADGILQTLAEFGAGADWVLKVDSDTLVMSLGWLGSMTCSVVGVGYPKNSRHLFGLCYAIRPDRIPSMRAQLAIAGEGPLPGEDILIGNAAAALGLLHSYELYAPGSPLWAWNWNQPRSVESVLRDFQVVCVQPRTGLSGPDREVAPILRKLFQARWP